MMYKTIDNSQVVTGTGNIIIVCGWTPIERIIKQIDPSYYATVGNLYSLAGVDSLIRNLLYNSYRELWVLNATKHDQNAGSCQALIDWFYTGTSQAVVGQDIPSEVLSQLRDETKLTVFNSLGQMKHAIAPIQLDPKSTHYYPPPAPITPQIFPGDMYGHRIEGKTIADAWVQILYRIRTIGAIRTMTDGLQSQELINVLSVIKAEPREFFIPDFLPVTPEFIKNYCQQFLTGQAETYTYGQRLREYFGVDQIEMAIATLAKNPDSSRVTLNLWDAAQDINHPTPPCLVNIWLRVVSGELSMTVIFRSHDIFNGYVANAMGLRFLQCHIADQLNLSIAPLMILSESAHLYSHSWDAANLTIRQEYNHAATYDDPAGNYLIKWDNGELVVCTHVDANGHYLRRYTGGSPAKILAQITRDNPMIQPSHAGYLGCELTKAVYLQAEYQQ